MKILNRILGLLMLAVLFSSCGGDDDAPDYTLYDISPLVNTVYKGSCVVSITDEQQNPFNIESTTVEFIKTSDPHKLTLKTSEFGLITTPTYILTNFLNTPDKKAYTFSMAGFNNSGLTGGMIPVYVTGWYREKYTEISKVNIALNGTTGSYVIANDSVKFTYNGTLTMTVKYLDNPVRDVSHKIRYEYKLKKQ